MCGIAGIAGHNLNDVERERCERMLDILRHRGPDDTGIEPFGNAILGHRRLSILDLSAAGHQPMLSSEGAVGVVFNGAIYNFRQLRSELEDMGFCFRSQTDTEVLVHGYKAWGFDALVAKLKGMFAIGLWDDERDTLFLVRDRLGVKPLCYAVSGSEIAFASTVRALKRAGRGGDLDEEGVIEFLEFGFLTDERSIYEGIEKVGAAEIVEWSGGKIHKRKYWDLPTDIREIDFEEALEETERLILQAVERRLQADVPVGALLSGGIDSSLVCWAIRYLGRDVEAFTVGTSGDEFDESGAASNTAKMLGIKHQVLSMSSDELPDTDDLVKAYAEPFACSSALGMLRISKEVRRSATVLLTGDGGDDVFLGYPEHKYFLYASKLAAVTPQPVANAWMRLRGAAPSSGPLKRASSFLNYSVGGVGAVASVRDGVPFYENHDILGPRLRDVSISHRQMKWSLDSGRNLLPEFLAYDQRTRFVGEYLPKVDGGTMFHSLEARSPFLDTDLWEFASTLPFNVRLRNGDSKAVLREIARRRIGPQLAGAKKQGFIIPVQHWLKGQWRHRATEIFRNSLLRADGWIDPDPVLKMLENSHGKNPIPRQVWFLLVLESWYRFERGAAFE